MIYIKQFDAKQLIAEATAQAASLTPSVLVAARLAGVTAVKFAQAMADQVKNAEYLASVTSELVTARIKQASKATEDAE